MFSIVIVVNRLGKASLVLSCQWGCMVFSTHAQCVEHWFARGTVPEPAVSIIQAQAHAAQHEEVPTISTGVCAFLTFRSYDPAGKDLTCSLPARTSLDLTGLDSSCVT